VAVCKTGALLYANVNAIGDMTPIAVKREGR
jgi:hypothetical protein